MSPPGRILPIIVFAQFCCTSIWFASNAVLPQLTVAFSLPASALGHLTSAVQLGFIAGTLVFALLSVADRFSPVRVFFLCAVSGALLNAGGSWPGHSLFSLLALRFGTGFFLAGIYPVGMKIAADYYRTGLGRSLGYLVGALVLGTAFPHLLRGLGAELPWRAVLWITSGVALLGGSGLWALVPDGPHRVAAARLAPARLSRIFGGRAFRGAAFGYFGHMWELYAFWAFVPLLLQQYEALHAGVELPVALLSFAIIGIGGPGCVLGGHLSGRWGTRRTAVTALGLSGGCCLLAPLLLVTAPVPIFVAFLLCWGLVVIADSPLFSTLVAHHSEPEVRGTALTLVNCIGFSITIVSIQLLQALTDHLSSPYGYWLLALGPVFGLTALYRTRTSSV